MNALKIIGTFQAEKVAKIAIAILQDLKHCLVMWSQDSANVDRDFMVHDATFAKKTTMAMPLFNVCLATAIMQDQFLLDAILNLVNVIVCLTLLEEIVEGKSREK